MFSAGNLLKNSFLLSLCKYTFLLIILNQNPKLNWSSSCALLLDNVQALVFAGLVNGLHYQLQMPVTFRYTLVINVLLVLFTVFLAIKVTAPTTILVAVFSILLCIAVLYNQ